MAKKRLIIEIIFLAIFVLCIFHIYADLLDISSTPSYSVNESLENLYTITVTNTGSPPGINFTQINITFPSGFTINAPTNGTSASGTLTINSQTLSWNNDSAGYHLVTSGTTEYFWINATSATPGTYNIVVTSLDTLSNTNTSNVTATINSLTDTISPSVSFISPTPSNDSTRSTNSIYARASASDNAGIDTISVSIYNSTLSLIDTETGTTSPVSKNFTLLDNGIYYIRATANDTSGNENSTALRKITLSYNVSCVPNWSCLDWSECVEGIQIRVCNDVNLCGDDSTKPNETQSCCSPSWQCTEWLPETCPKNQTQTRICTDLNSCNTTQNKPAEIQSCEYKNSTFFYIITVIIIVFVIIITISIIRYIKQRRSIQKT